MNIRLLELGASAGLNLRADRFAYQVGGVILGDPTSPVRLVEPWVGVPFRDPGRVRVRVMQRAGCDRDPVDPTTVEGRLTLASYVWADQVTRMARLRAALRVAALVPARVERAGAADRLVFELRLTGWSAAGERHLLLAEAEGHGPPVRWWPPEGSAVIPAAR